MGEREEKRGVEMAGWSIHDVMCISSKAIHDILSTDP